MKKRATCEKSAFLFPDFVNASPKLGFVVRLVEYNLWLCRLAIR